jgi:hypothetical protein
MKISKTTALVIALGLMTASPAIAAGTNTKSARKAANMAAGQTLAMANPAKVASAVVPPNAQIQMPPPEAMIIMIRSSLVALSQANTTNNYQVLSALGSNNFRQANPPARLAQLFAPFRNNNIDLAPVVFVTPQLSQQPKIEDGKLRLAGYFPTQPMRVNYDLVFEPAAGVWKLFGLSVNLDSVVKPAMAQSLGR